MVAFAIVIFFFPLTLLAQDEAKPLLQDPSEILQLASTANGLAMPAAKPWHIKVSYDRFDEDGDNVESETFEEFYVSPKKYKLIYAGDSLNQTDVATDSGLYRSGDQRWPNSAEYEVPSKVLRPLHQAPVDPSRLRLEKAESISGSTKLSCVVSKSADKNVIFLGSPTFCFDPNTVMLRYVRGDMAETTLYNNIVQFQNRYVAKDITVMVVDRVFLKIHVEELGEIAKAGESFFAPPAESAGPLTGRVTVPSNILMQEYLISAPTPEYPRGIDGKVEVNFVIGKDRSVIEATATGGPAKLQKAVLEAVRKYRFRPYLVLDQPMEIEASTSFQYNSR